MLGQGGICFTDECMSKLKLVMIAPVIRSARPSPGQSGFGLANEPAIE